MPRQISTVSTLLAPLAAILALSTAPPAQAQHEHSIVDVGRILDGSLFLHTHATQPFPVPESIFPGYPGYATAELAFESTIAPGPHGLLPLDPACDIRVILVSIDPGLSLYNGVAPMMPGEEMVLGPPFFHYLPLWTIDPGPLDQVFSAILYAHDAAGIHPDSDLFELQFTSVPSPGAAAPLLAAGVIGLAHRRRRPPRA